MTHETSFSIRSGSALLCALLLAACSSTGQRAAVEERGGAPRSSQAVAPKKSMQPARDWRPAVYVVQKGDTLYSIAFNHGFDYRELAEMNGIQNPNLIQVGQEIRLFPQAATSPRLMPESKPVGAETRPVVVEARAEPKPEAKPVEIVAKSQPKAVLLPYSEQAVGQAEAQSGESNKAETVARSEPESKPAKTTAKPEAVAESVKPVPVPVKSESRETARAETQPPAETASDADDEDAVEWQAPTSGRVVGEFSESANRKGVDIAGKQGQPIYASAAGKVVYSGSGLRGYGKLVIIKHNKTYISAYAHNDQILVKEREMVKKGQKIAEMGNTDADQVKLHFEIRKFGKPIDPSKLLPPIRP